jgi:hypothetical protein
MDTVGGMDRGIWGGEQGHNQARRPLYLHVPLWLAGLASYSDSMARLAYATAAAPLTGSGLVHLVTQQDATTLSTHC